MRCSSCFTAREETDKGDGMGGSARARACVCVYVCVYLHAGMRAWEPACFGRVVMVTRLFMVGDPIIVSSTARLELSGLNPFDLDCLALSVQVQIKLIF